MDHARALARCTRSPSPPPSRFAGRRTPRIPRLRWIGVWTAQEAGTTYHWRFRTRTDSPFFPRTPWFSLAGNGPTEADLRTQPDPSSIPQDAAALTSRIESVAPQPLEGASVVRFSIATAAHVRLTVHDVSGRRVALLADRAFGAGGHDVAWDGRSEGGTLLASGVYFARLDAGGVVSHERIVVAR